MKNQYLFYGKVIAVAAVLMFALSFLPAPNNTPVTASDKLTKFASEAELSDFLQSASSNNMYYSTGAGSVRTLGAGESSNAAPTSAPAAVGADQSAKSVDYSSTNVQIAGVDESDFVKNDDKYIYKISGSEVVIVDAFPAETMNIVSTINLSGSNPSNLYVSDNRLVVIGNEYNYYPLREDVVTTPTSTEKVAADFMPPRYNEPTTYVKVYDITDRTNPVLSRDLVFNGSYYDSRMIGDYVYAIINVPTYTDRIPVFSPYQTGFPDIYYFPIPDYSYQYTNIVSVNVKEDVPVQNKVFMLGYSTNLFVSENNIYMVYQKQLDSKYTMNRILDEAYLPVLPQDVVTEINSIRNSAKSDYRKNGEIQLVLNDWMQSNPEQAANIQKSVQTKLEEIQADFERERDKSVIHKVSISNGNINYIANGEVPGTPLNQFSMDESNGFFRIATTTNNWKEPVNNLYVLDGSMSVVGKIENMAKGERIYSARFLGNRAYLVTFVRMDPLFVIDLSDPVAPKVLGELKIPGVSEYLHPYDENTIIGIGQSTQEIQDRVTFKGLKISLFDVTDVANPVEKAKYEIGDQGTYSEALYDHKAFLFSKEKNLLVIPVTVYEKNSSEYYGSNVFNGVYAFSLTSSEIALKGRITHTNATEIWNNAVRRSLFMDNVLYTVSDGKIKANSLTDISEISSIDLPVQYYHGPYYYTMGGGVSGSSGMLKTVDEVPATQ